jgi:osmoprotectant transport system ATP-binding protein
VAGGDGDDLLGAMIEFRDVSFHRGTTPILRQVTLTVGRGEVVALVGRSGSGKTTLLRLVNRMLTPSGGDVRGGGRLRRQTGYVIQDVGLFPHRTIAGNIATVPSLLGWSPERIAARVDELMTLVDLPPLAYRDRWPDELSGGQRQRVGLARALAADPPVVLMDEPFGAVDPMTRVELHREFLRLQYVSPRTVLLVTHDLLEAAALAARIAVLDEGRLIACDTPQALEQSIDPVVRALLDTRPGGHA